MPIVKLAPAAKCQADAAKDLSLLLENGPAAAEGSEYLFSTIPGKESEVVSGDNAGLLLSAWIDLQGKECLGTDAAGYDTLPVSIKKACYDENHLYYTPDNQHAGCWYVAKAGENAAIYFGVREEIEPEQLEAALKKGTWKQLLQPVDAKQGDLFQVDGGTVYAVEGEIELLEVSLELPGTQAGTLEEAAANLNLKPIAHDYHKSDWVSDGQAERAEACSNNVFEFDLYQLNGRMDMDCDNHSFKALVILDGSAVIEKDDMVLHAVQWNSFLACANTSTFTITGNCRFALVHLVGPEDQE